VEHLISDFELAMVCSIVTRRTNGDHFIGVVNFIDCPMLDVVNVTPPVRAAGVCALPARLIDQLALLCWLFVQSALAQIRFQTSNVTYSVLSPKPGGNQAPKYSGKRNGGIKRVGLKRGAARKLRLWGFESSRAAQRGMFEG
jgi:hypothetical protein